MLNTRFFQKDATIAILLFFITLAIYLATTCPVTYMEDGAEFVTIAATLSIGHPPGFPLYTLLGKLFSYLPFGTVAFRVNIMSGVWAALTIAFLYLIIKKLTSRRLIACLVSLTFAFTAQFWLRSVYAEAYTLNTLFLVATAYLLILWSETKKESWLIWFCFLYGLSLIHHHLMAPMAVPYLFFILYRQFCILKNPKLILRMFLAFLLGLCIYIYVPLRAFGEPVINWRHPDNVSNLISEATSTLQVNIILPKINIFFQYFFNFFEQLNVQYSIPLFLMGFLGIIFFIRRNCRYFILVMMMFLLAWLVPIYLYCGGYNETYVWFLGVLYIPAYLLFSIFIAYGFVLIFESINRIKRNIVKKILLITAVLGLLVSPVYLFISNFEQNNLANFYLSDDYVREVLDSLDHEAVLVVETGDDPMATDIINFTLGYLKYVEKMRPDVTVIAYNELFPKVEGVDQYPADLLFSDKSRNHQFIELAWREICQSQQRPCYSIDLSAEAEQEGYYFRSNGIIYRVFKDEEQAEQFEKSAVPVLLRNDAVLETPKDVFAKNLLARYHFNLASYYIERGERDKSLEHLLKAIDLDEVPMSQRYQEFVTHRTFLLDESQL